MNRKGTSLPETLVACALAAMLVLVAGQMQVDARRLQAAGEVAALQAQVGELASELLSYNLSLAGHSGVHALLDIGGPALEVARGAAQGGSDALTVRFVEERWRSTPVVRELRFEARRDGSGRWNLYMREAGATRQPAVQDVTGLRVAGFLGSDGTLLPASTPLPLDAVGIGLDVDFAFGESRTLLVSFAASERVEAGQ